MSKQIFCPNHTHFSKYFSHPQITRSCTLDADHSSIPNNALCLPHSLSQKKNWGGGGGGGGGGALCISTEKHSVTLK